jgi:hypothetical protein
MGEANAESRLEGSGEILASEYADFPRVGKDSSCTILQDWGALFEFIHAEALERGRAKDVIMQDVKELIQGYPTVLCGSRWGGRFPPPRRQIFRVRISGTRFCGALPGQQGSEIIRTNGCMDRWMGRSECRVE